MKALAAAVEEARVIGRVLAMSPGAQRGRLYVCDPDAHAVHVLDDRCQPLFSFGRRGSRVGHFNRPSDVAVILLDAEDPLAPGTESALLAVADCGNHRVQLFELDGAPLGAFGSVDWPLAAGPARIGWPYFRSVDAPALSFPSRLRWRTPHLEVTCADEAVVRIDLADSVLPDFTEWLRGAPETELRLAIDHFAAKPGSLPDSYLYGMCERLLPARRPMATASKGWA